MMGKILPINTIDDRKETGRDGAGNAFPTLEQSDWVRSRIMSHYGHYPDSIGKLNQNIIATGCAFGGAA